MGIELTILITKNSIKERIYIKMINIQKILTTCLISTLCLGFVGCAKTTTTVDPTPSTQTSPSTVTNNVVINSFSDLNNNLNIGCQSGSVGEDWLLSNTNNSTISKYKVNQALVNDVVNGNIDAIIIDETYAQYLINNNTQVKINTIKFQTEELGFAFRKGDVTYRNSVNDVIKSYKKDGTIDELIDIYMPLSGDIVLPDKIAYNSDYTTTIKVGTSSDFAPFEYHHNDTLYGFDITLIEMIADANQWNVEFIDMNFNDLLTSLNNEEIDMIASGMSITDDRHNIVDFSETYYSSEQVIVTRK